MIPGEHGVENAVNQCAESHCNNDIEKHLDIIETASGACPSDMQVPLMNITDKENHSQVPQGNSHIYFEDNVSIHSCNSEPFESFNDLDDWRPSAMDEAMSCGEMQHNEEWITVSKKNKRRGKAKSYDTVSQRPLTRSKSLLLQKTLDEVRLPITALFDP